WVYRRGFERAKRYLLTGDEIPARTAAEIGLVLEVVPDADLQAYAFALARRMAQVPVNQLVMLKLLVNQTAENMGLAASRTLGTLFDGVARHTQEGLDSVRRAGAVGVRQAVRAARVVRRRLLLQRADHGDDRLRTDGAADVPGERPRHAGDPDGTPGARHGHGPRLREVLTPDGARALQPRGRHRSPGRCPRVHVPHGERARQQHRRGAGARGARAPGSHRGRRIRPPLPRPRSPAAPQSHPPQYLDGDPSDHGG